VITSVVVTGRPDTFTYNIGEKNLPVLGAVPGGAEEASQLSSPLPSAVS